MDQQRGDRLSHYQLIEKVGEGGMGIVWKAFDTQLERAVAIKVLADSLTADAARLARFEREARTLAALNHPNIVTIYSVESVAGRHFLTMEWIAGRTLGELLAPTGLPYSGFLEIAGCVAAAIAAAEEQGIVHRDLKPANVMVANSGQVKVLDFGLARSLPAAGAAVSREATTRPLSDAGEVAGTLPYMAPELLRGEVTDARSDLFALGVLFFELATGRKPFEGRTVAELTAAILRDEPPPITDLRAEYPTHVDWIVRRCLAKEPANRFASARELEREIAGLHLAPPDRAVAEHSIAVLPFADMSQERDQEYFCLGIAEEITNALSRIADLHVASRSSAFRFATLAVDPREMGRRLGVKTLLTGSVRKAGQRVRITTELTDVAEGFVLWSERFDRELADIFAVQDEIAESVVQALQVSLSPRERRAIRSVATVDAEAYEYYLRGRPLLYQHTRRGIESARALFRRAVELDPKYALAHAGLADCCSFFYLYVDRDAEQRDCALAASRQALELDPELAQAHVAHGMALSLFERSDEAVAEFERALALEPRSYDAHYFYAREARMRGEKEKTAALFERAFEIRPDDFQAPALLGQAYVDLGRAREAAVARRRAVSNADEQLRQVPDDIRALYMSANALIALGETEAGLDRARRAAAFDPDDCMLLYNVACIFSQAGRLDEALAHLERSVAVGNIQPRYYEQDSDLDPLRGLSRFQALMGVLAQRKREAEG